MQNPKLPELTLVRLLYTDDGTFGTLIYNCQPFAKTIELPWRNNSRNISCIPTGEYLVSSRYSAAPFNRVLYEVQNVPNRSGILIHRGNYAGDKAMGRKSHFAGCIGLGDKIVRDPNGQKMMTWTEDRVAQLEKTLNLQPFKLIITS
jgi:hypothetical protein